MARADRVIAVGSDAPNDRYEGGVGGEALGSGGDAASGAADSSVSAVVTLPGGRS
jgi:hypothetical protein